MNQISLQSADYASVALYNDTVGWAKSVIESKWIFFLL